MAPYTFETFIPISAAGVRREVESSSLAPSDLERTWLLIDNGERTVCVGDSDDRP